MQNVNVKVTGQVATITVKLDAPGSPSKTGKTDVIASTHGNTKINGTDLYLGLNLYRRR